MFVLSSIYPLAVEYLLSFSASSCRSVFLGKDAQTVGGL